MYILVQVATKNEVFVIPDMQSLVFYLPISATSFLFSFKEDL